MANHITDRRERSGGGDIRSLLASSHPGRRWTPRGSGIDRRRRARIIWNTQVQYKLFYREIQSHYCESFHGPCLCDEHARTPPVFFPKIAAPCPACSPVNAASKRSPVSASDRNYQYRLSPISSVMSVASMEAVRPLCAGRF